LKATFWTEIEGDTSEEAIIAEIELEGNLE
jgi:hypothetical protein